MSGGGGGARRIAVHHPDRSWRRHSHARSAGVSQRRADARCGRAQHHRRALRGSRDARGAVSARRHAGGRDRGRATARRLWHRRTSGLAPTVAAVDRLGRGVRRPRVDQRRQRMARRAARADCPRVGDVSVACPGVDGHAARSAVGGVGAMGSPRGCRAACWPLPAADAHARLGFSQRTDPDMSAIHVPLPGYEAIVPRVLESCRPRRAIVGKRG